MTLTGAKEMGFEGTSPQRLARGRRVAVVVLGAILAAVACAIIGAALVRGSWWYSYGTDRALSSDSRARVGAIRDEVDADSRPRIVLLLDRSADRFLAHRAGADACVLKPIDSADLRQALAAGTDEEE